MPGNVNTSAFEIPFPIKGVDRSLPLAAQPVLTCPDALNVRAFAASDRMGGGKRAGLDDAFDRAGTSGARTIHGLARLTEAAGTPSTAAGSYVAVTEAWSGLTVAVPTYLGTDLVPFFISSATVATNAADAIGLVAGTYLAFDATASSGAGQAYGVGVNFQTSNSVTAVFRANGQSTVVPDTNGGDGECTHMGPFIRGNGLFTNFIATRFIRAGANSVTLQLIQVSSGAAPTVLATLASGLALGGAAGLTNDLTMTLTEISGTIRATVSWPTQGANFTISVDTVTSTYSGNTGAGVAFVGATTWSAANSNDRFVVSVAYTKIVPADPTIIHQYLGTTTNAQASPERYHVPDGWTTFRLPTPSGAATTEAGPTQGSASTPLRIDDTSDVLVQSVSATNPYGGIYRTSETTRYAVEVRHLSTATPNFADPIAVALRISKTAGATLYDHIGVRLTSGSPAPASATRDTTKCISFSSGSVISVLGGTGTHTQTTITATLNGWVCLATDWIRVADDGATITISVNGRTIQTISTATYTSNTINGAYPREGAGSGAFGFRLIDQGAASSASIGEATSKIAIFTTGLVDIGTLNTATLTRCSGNGLNNMLVEAASFNKKWYAVDGDTSKVITASTSVVEDWSPLVTAGALPTGCRFIAVYRGRMILARQSTNASIWYASRVANPLDWDYGASPTNTAAVAGTNADVGQPGDAITALIPFSDDYLIFGCANSIWMLEGDPGYGGAIQNVSYQTGVIGPRSWCFDEDGVLYFMGSGGFYKMIPGQRTVTPISGRRLAYVLDRVDTDTTLVQLAYDAFKAHVHIFLTPTDGTTVGTHIVWDKRADAFWPDQYPVRAGPMAVCQIVGTDDEDRRILLGGTDGYVRRFLDSATTDFDTTGSGDTATAAEAAISSYVKFPTIQAPGSSEDVFLSEFQAAFDNQYAATMTYLWRSGSSADAVNDIALGTYTKTGTMTAGSGFNTPVRLRIAAGAIQLALQNNVSGERWALEHVTAFVGRGSRRRA